ncbi:MAG: Tex family protein [Anaerovoracaceae bacterium]
MNIIAKIAQEFSIKESQIESTVKLIDEGNTIPFIARYRKEVTGGLSDVVLRDLDERLTYLRGLEERKEEVIRLIEEQGKLTPELKEDIVKAEVLQRVEDLYKPFKQKKATRASKAKEKGLEPLAGEIFAQKAESGSLEEMAKEYINLDLGVETTDDAIAGAMDIIAEMISDDPELTAILRDKTYNVGIIKSEGVDKEEKSVYEMYYDASEGISKIPNHRVLAINRGEKEKKLKVKIVTIAEEMEAVIAREVIKNEKSIFVETLGAVISDAYKRLIAPSLEREMRNVLTERAEGEAVKIFAKNTEKLLMVPPVKGARIISIDPGYRTGCKVAVLNQTGKLLAYTTIFPTKPKEDIKGTEAVFDKLIERFKANTFVIGNGTASRETEEVVANYIKKKSPDMKYTIVNEAGASVYSASKIATEEYPDLDVTTRGAMSLGRRLQDPLAELVKIPTKSIGVGQYQHDINQKNLETALDNVVEDCVNRVGVDLNTASPSLLSHIAGINGTIAKNIVSYREENGDYTDRKELKKVAKLGPKAFEQCAGFMRISGAKNPLDGTSVHPESYKVAEAMLKKLELDVKGISNEGLSHIEEKICQVYGPKEEKSKPKTRAKGFAALAELQKADNDNPLKNLGQAIKNMAEDLEVGELTLKDIVDEIKKPGRDPREDAPAVVFRNDVRDFDDLKPGMEMTGTVRNVVDFGAFVDIGVKNDGLVHISQLSNKFIKHPMDVVSVGDNVKVKILEIDKAKGKVALTMKL